jgi:dTDP-4-amino-4,6-dideoxygalactose transaminase
MLDAPDKVSYVVPVHDRGEISKRWACDDGGFVMHDACPSLGASYDGIRLGATDECVAFSLHASKIVTGGEGGLFVGPPENAAIVRRLRNHGFSGNKVVSIGHNYHMSELAAAVALAQVRRFEWLRGQRLEIVEIYDQAFESHARPLGDVENRAEGSHWAYFLDVGEQERRDAAMRQLLASGIECKPGRMLCHKQPAYEGYPKGDLSNSERLSACALRIPLFPMEEGQLDHVIKVTKAALS